MDATFSQCSAAFPFAREPMLRQFFLIKIPYADLLS